MPTRCAGWSAAWPRRPWPGASLLLYGPMLPPVRRGILGGTFDPPHLAHLVAGEAAYRELGLDVVTFLPAGRPWQKAGLGVSPAGDRWEMTRRAVAGVGYFAADDREVGRDGWTYTADTLASFPDSEELVLILGADAAAGLPTWHAPEAVLGRARVAVMERPGVERAAVEAAAGAVEWLDTPLLPISGTLLRARRRAGLSLRFLVPDAVLAYIESVGLYAAD
jgi:nicotinate-nucleotide adenylyltransferase